MKRIILFALSFLMVCPMVFAERRNFVSAPKEESHINWLSMDELQVKMKQQPKKVYMDMYTDWCGWCKKMEATTFSHPEVVKYMNDNFYCVRFNAERKDTFMFMYKAYYFDPAKRANTLAFELMQGKLTYPTSIIMEERYQNPQPRPGYLKVSDMEMIVKYFGDNIYRSTKWEDHQKTFKGSWEPTEATTPAPVTPPAGH